MTDKLTLERQLYSMLDDLQSQYNRARAANDTQTMEKLEVLAARLNKALDRFALLSLFELSDEVAALRKLIDGGTSQPPSPAEDAEALQKEIEAILAQSSEEEVATEPVPSEPVVAPEDITAPPPPAVAGGPLTLTEAHLIALWKRSQFPLPTAGIVVFGIRGCRPVDYSGTDFGPGHALEMRELNYTTMNCTIGLWKPGKGLALFPGSTVPYRGVVAGAVSKGGKDVNQLGRGRYKKYIPGWHKFSEGASGHWALRQSCFITLQRTGDDLDYDGNDPWTVTEGAGDNIHCAFGMGPDGKIPDAKFSSAGCQTIAGLVTKGTEGSERGPWKKFIAPFRRGLSQEYGSTEYVLFDAAEVQQMIVNRCKGKSVILRFGSEGALVKKLQASLKARGADVGVDGDFGPETFNAIKEFQIKTRGSVDGIVGAETAGALGFELPQFEFDSAISGNPGYSVTKGSVGRQIAWGQVTAKHPNFNETVLDLCERLHIDPDHLMAVMAFETGETFAPDKKNAAGSGATGLIQFMGSTAEDLGTSTAALAAMTATEQLKWVEKYFRRVAAGRNLASLSDVYMAVLWPAAIGKPESYALFVQGTKQYTQNDGLDVNKDGVVTKAEATAKVQQKLVKGLAADRIG
ncbi:peptidoglycan-binding protein [Ciceribacter sp. L1K23]|uniref:peptidoglycan-binding protein n=1 Tax=Ciceribacter sp. L1K23 TaxID=2820276 RepID=UPI001B815259|nr:peptidoglycan-binding protein [Ciceribacter sp. L1K23]MBR0556524.1 peptidoglycan-binding protein [Ciceribacter sp. L1K23]